MAKYKVGYFVGSLSSTSINRELSKAVIRLAPEDLEFTEIPIRNLPLYSPDYDADYPPEANALKDAIHQAQAVLFVTPEYNRSIPGALKNAIDWASRGTDQPFNGKPYAITSASQGPLGGARCQYDLRKMLIFLNAHALNKPEIFIGSAPTKFDASGRLTDEPTRKILGEQMVALRDHVNWVKRAYG